MDILVKIAQAIFTVAIFISLHLNYEISRPTAMLVTIILSIIFSFIVEWELEEENE